MRLLVIPAYNAGELLFKEIAGKTVLDRLMFQAKAWMFPEIVIAVPEQYADMVRETVGEDAFIVSSEAENISESVFDALEPFKTLPDQTEVTVMSPWTLFEPMLPPAAFGVQRKGPTVVGSAVSAYTRNRSYQLTFDAVTGQALEKFEEADDEPVPGIVSVGVFCHTLQAWRVATRAPGEIEGHDFLKRMNPIEGFPITPVQIPNGMYVNLASQVNVSVFDNRFAEADEKPIKQEAVTEE